MDGTLRKVGGNQLICLIPAKCTVNRICKAKAQPGVKFARKMRLLAVDLYYTFFSSNDP